MKKITIELVQHTPMLHFDRTPGATLRATEVKPKLDRFLIKNLFHGSVPEEFLIKDTNALDYKMRIRSSAGTIGTWEQKPPMYFGNTDPHTENPKYKSINAKPIIEILVSSPALSSRIDDNEFDFLKYLSAFFFETNFGTRQTKGYGNFFPTKIKGKKYTLNNDMLIVNEAFVQDYKSRVNVPILHFSITAENITRVMEKVQWFYQSLRQGINMHGVYMKPMIFLYAESKGIQWEKKTIKDKFYSNAKINNNAKAVKTVFGLSSVETWEYADGGQKNTVFNTVEFNSENFDRVPSPLTIKIFPKTQQDYEVYIIMNEELMSKIQKDILGRSLFIKTSNKTQNNKREIGTMQLPIIEEFNWHDFWEFVINKKKEKITEFTNGENESQKEIDKIKMITRKRNLTDNERKHEQNEKRKKKIYTTLKSIYCTIETIKENTRI